MADMTNSEFKAEAEKLGNNPQAQSIVSFLGKLGSLDGYDMGSLDKIVDLMETAGDQLPLTLADSLGNNIIYQRKVIEVRDAFLSEQHLRTEASYSQFAALRNTNTALGNMNLEELARLRLDINERKIFGDVTTVDVEFFRTAVDMYVKNEGATEVFEEELRKQRAERKQASQQQAYANTEDTSRHNQSRATESSADRVLNSHDFDELTSYNMLQMYKTLSFQYHQIETLSQSQKLSDAQTKDFNMLKQTLDNIEVYANDQLQSTDLSHETPDGEQMLLSQNAPTINDYVDILTAMNPSYEYENPVLLRAALMEFDRDNGLDKDLPDANKIFENESRWQELFPVTNKALPIEYQNSESLGILRTTDKDTYNELFDTLRAVTITELAIEEPGEDKDATKKYYQKYQETVANYMYTASVTLEGINNDDEQRKKWWEEYAKANHLPLDNLSSIMSAPEHQEAYKNFVVTNVYKTLNATYTEKNAVYASRLAQKTDMPRVLQTAAKQKASLWERNPQLMQAVKQGGKKAAIKIGASVGFGIIGATAAQAWQTIETFKQEVGNCKKDNGGKFSLKLFAKYLKKHPEAAINLAKDTLMTATVGVAAAALCASGGAVLGAAGMLGGAVATNIVGGAAINGVRRVVGATVSGIAGAGVAWYTHKQLKPKKEALMAILQQYVPEDKIKGEYKNLTKMFKNGDKTLSAKIEQLDLPAEQAEKVKQLAQEIRAMKIKERVTIGGTALGALATAYFMGDSNDATTTPAEPVTNVEQTTEPMTNVEQTTEPVTNTENTAETAANSRQSNETATNSGQSNEATTKSGQGNESAANEVKTHTFNLSDSKIVEQPNATYAILKEMGLIDKDKFSIKPGIGATSSSMSEYLKQLQLTEEQQKAFQAKLDNGEFDKIKQDLDNHKIAIGKDGEVIKSGGAGNAAEATKPEDGKTAGAAKPEDGKAAGAAKPEDGKAAGAVANAENAAQPGTVSPKVIIKDVGGTEQSAPQTVEITGHSKKSGLFSFLHKKQDHIFTIEKTGDINKDVENYAYQAAIQQQLEKAGIQSPNPAQIAAAKALVDQKGYAITGNITGEDGQEHKFKIVQHKDGSITRTIDGQKAKINVSQNGGNNVEYSTFKHVKLPANTVLDPEAQAKATAGGGTYVSEKMDKLRGTLTTRENNMATTYKAITDGDTNNDFIVKEQAGKVVEVKRVGNASAVLKQLSKNAQNMK